MMEMTDGKVAVVVGGGSGLAAGAAKALHAEGFQIAIMSSSGKGEALAVDLDGIGVTGSNLVVADLQTLVDLVMQDWGRA